MKELLETLKGQYTRLLNDYIHELSTLYPSVAYEYSSLQHMLTMINFYSAFLNELLDAKDIGKIRDVILKLDDTAEKPAALKETVWQIFKYYFRKASHLDQQLDDAANASQERIAQAADDSSAVSAGSAAFFADLSDDEEYESGSADETNESLRRLTI